MDNKQKNTNDIIKRRLQEIDDDLKDFSILIRVNNLLLSKFILQLSNISKELNIPKRVSFFRFELLKSEYQELIKEFSKEEVDKALFRLDRLLIKNKQECPNNIRKYIATRLKKSQREKQKRNENKQSEQQ